MAFSRSSLSTLPVFAGLPLAMAFIVEPLRSAYLRYQTGTVASSDSMVWLLLSVVGIVLASFRPTPGAPRGKQVLFKLFACGLLLSGLLLYSHDYLTFVQNSLPYLWELSPLVYLLFAVLWAQTVGMVDRTDFQRYGCLLGMLCVVDLVAELVLFRTVSPVRWIGDVDMLAGLLLVALCAGLRPGENEGGIAEPDQGNRFLRAMVFVGIVACLSRTALFATGWVVLSFGRGSLFRRLGLALICVAALVVTFYLPTTPADAGRYVGYWLWLEAVKLFREFPALLATGVPFGDPLPIDFPMGIRAVWEAATGSLASSGVHLSQVSSFWLRLSLGWGVGVPIVLMTGAFVFLSRHMTRLGAGLVSVLFAQGMVTPLLYNPHMAIPICLAFGLALEAMTQRGNVRFDQPPEKQDVPQKESPDPVEEWNMKPL